MVEIFVHIVRERATPQMVREMLLALETYIKVAVDVRRGILAGGAELHADGEQLLLEDGSLQEDVWGADWLPASQEVELVALINIRPRHRNASMIILDPVVREHVEAIVQRLLGGVMPS